MAGHLAHALRQGIDGAALDALAGNHHLAAHPVAGIGQCHVLHRRSGKAFAEHFRPVDQKAAVGRLERIDPDAGALQDRHPRRIGAQMRPTGAAHGKDGGRSIEARPAAACHERHAQAIETVEPGAQQRRGFHLFGKHPARGAGKGLDPQPIGPGDERFRRKSADGGFEKRPRLAIALEKQIERFRMGEVQPAAPGQQKLARRCRHVIENAD